MFKKEGSPLSSFGAFGLKSAGAAVILSLG
jgi:hypothetical protein